MLELTINGDTALSSQLLLGVDAGGTFTDFVLVNIGSTVSVKIHKTLSTPAAPEEAIMQGIEEMGLQAMLDSGELQLIHGSTVATNAVLEGRLAKTAFISNRGFADILTLGRQTRPSLYELEFPPIEPPVPVELCLETGGRLSVDGEILDDLSEDDLNYLVESLKKLKPEAVAVTLLFSFLDDRFEKQICAAIKKANLPLFVSRSSSVLPEYKEYERGIATWLNAALGPVVNRYLTRLQAQLSGTAIQIMQSTGETIAATKAADAAIKLLLSGPAGGLTAIRFLAQQTNTERIISFDMGGTSTDVALYNNGIGTTSEGTIAQYPVGVSMVDMETIGAGGGSIAYVDTGGMLQVGPRSAGALPGPVCYDQGGIEATVTDANLVLGHLAPEAKLASGLSLNLEKARYAIGKLAEQINLSTEETAAGIVSIANELMAKAIRLISVNRGFDSKDFTLASFGGAGGLHVCALAEAMTMSKAIVPVNCGVFSALGMVVADRGRQFSKTVNLQWNDFDAERLEQQLLTLEHFGRTELEEEGLESAALQVARSVDVRYRGQSYMLNVEWNDRENAASAFEKLHKLRYGYTHSGELELINIRVHVWLPHRNFTLPAVQASNHCNNVQQTVVYGLEAQAEVMSRVDLNRDQAISGPAIITEYSSTTFVAAGWQARIDDFGNLLLMKLLS